MIKLYLTWFLEVQNRNTGYSENLFSHNSRVENNALNSIEGATALKLDESYTRWMNKSIINQLKILKIKINGRKFF